MTDSQVHIVGPKNSLEGDVVTYRLVIKSPHPRQGAKARAVELNLQGIRGDITPEKLKGITTSWKGPEKLKKRSQPYGIYKADNRWEVRSKRDGTVVYVLKIVQITLDDEVVEAISLIVP